jgi:prepilin-type processing-associated H-X9-DG protein
MLDYSNMKKSAFLEQGVSCPSDLTPNKNYTDTPVFNLSMLYNNYFGMKYPGFVPQTEMVKTGTIRKPSICGVIIEGHMASSSPASRGMNWIVTGPIMATNATEFRHNMRSNVLYFDGHTDKLSKLEILAMPNISSQLQKGN